MSRSWVLCVALCAYVSVIQAIELGTGKLEVIAINKCERECHKFKFDLEPLTINDTHNGCRGRIVSEVMFTDKFGMRVNICKYEEDECHQVLVLSETSMFEFFKKYLEEDKRKAFLEACGVNPPEMPIKEGTYELYNYSYESKMPGVYGAYNVKVIILEGDEEVGCIEYFTKFHKLDEDCSREGNEK